MGSFQIPGHGRPLAKLRAKQLRATAQKSWIDPRGECRSVAKHSLDPTGASCVYGGNALQKKLPQEETSAWTIMNSIHTYIYIYAYLYSMYYMYIDGCSRFCPAGFQNLNSRSGVWSHSQIPSNSHAFSGEPRSILWLKCIWICLKIGYPKLDDLSSLSILKCHSEVHTLQTDPFGNWHDRATKTNGPISSFK